MAQIVFCTTAQTAEDAAREANETTAVRTWAPAAAGVKLPDGTDAGTVCDRDTGKKHWLLEHPDQVDLEVAIAAAQVNGEALIGTDGLVAEPLVADLSVSPLVRP